MIVHPITAYHSPGDRQPFIIFIFGPLYVYSTVNTLMRLIHIMREQNLVHIIS